jgi:hypothetical protein
MKIAIIGEHDRSSAWEKHLRKLNTIQEVLISSTLESGLEADGLLLLDSTPDNLSLLNRAVKLGYHSYLISPIRYAVKELRSIYHAAQEANVQVQFSHWPSFAPSSLWIRQNLNKPVFIQVKKEFSYLKSASLVNDFEHHWSDEIAYIVRIMGSNIHQLDVKFAAIEELRVALNISLRYEDASVASIQMQVCGSSDIHQRVISDRNQIFDCNVLTQKVNHTTARRFGKLSTRTETFDRRQAAELSVIQFIKSIQSRKTPLFSIYDAMQAATVIEKIRLKANV